MNRTNRFRSVALVSLLCTVTFSPSFAKIIYVDDDAPPPGDGTSWTTAYTYLQDALADAESADKPLEIRVAQGLYKPDQGANQTPGDVEAVFHLVGGISLRGGFAGLDQPDPNARDFDAQETILSGDLDGDDRSVTHPADMLDDGNRVGNSYSVVTVQDPNGTVTIEGVTVAGGDRTFESYTPTGGAGISCHENSSPSISRCRFTANFVLGNYGGAVFGGAPRLTNCTFEGNFAGFGGAVSYSTGPIRNCRFAGNAAESGGALSEHSGSIHDCSFIGNSAANKGGALHACTGTVTNSALVGNSAGEGGSVFLRHIGTLTMRNCTFAQNVAAAGQAIGSFPRRHDDPTIAHLTNCILWDSGDEIRAQGASTVRIRYSVIKGGQASVYDPCSIVVWEQGNIEADPLFADAGYWDANGTPDNPNDDLFVEGDYHLKSQAGRWDPDSESWVIDDVTSPCIDAGDPNLDHSAEVWPDGGRINTGAYGGTPEASLSSEPTDLFLPRIACIYWESKRLAESCQSFLQAHACPTTLIRSEDIIEHPLDGYDLIIIATDTSSPAVWANDQTITAPVESGKPILGLGQGGYRFFGRLGLTIGYPNGAKMPSSDVYVVDPDSPLYTGSYPVAVPEDRVLQVYDDDTDCVVLYLWPAPPESVTALGRKVDDPGYFPLAAEQGHLLWGFADSPDEMTDTGKHLFLNAVILTANAKLESAGAPAP